MDYLTSPIPHYSGKRSWVKPVWDRLGNPDVYLETRTETPILPKPSFS